MSLPAHHLSGVLSISRWRPWHLSVMQPPHLSSADSSLRTRFQPPHANRHAVSSISPACRPTITYLEPLCLHHVSSTCGKHAVWHIYAVWHMCLRRPTTQTADQTTQRNALRFRPHNVLCSGRKGHFMLALLMALPDRSPIASPKICNSRCRAGHATGRCSVWLKTPVQPGEQKSLSQHHI